MSVYLKIQPITRIGSGSRQETLEGEKPRTTDPNPKPQFFGPLDEKAAKWPYSYFAEHGWDVSGGYVRKVIDGVRPAGSWVTIPHEIRPLGEFTELSKKM